MSDKKRILFVGEASFLSTGFSTYYRELIPRLVKTGKYEIGEIGCYARQDDPRADEFIQGRWKFWGNMPTTQEEAEAFNQPSQHPRDKGQNINQFGANVFDKVCAEFQPDLVIAIRDNWMDSYILRSPFREWFKLLWMPTVDSPFQAEEWLDDYAKCDLVMSYSDFGVHTLKTEGRGKIKVFPQPLRTGVDLETFKPTEGIKEKMGLSPDIPIIGTVQRNQSRKLILDLIDAFSYMKSKYRGEKAVDKSVLLLHTAWPDNAHSYNYPRHIWRLNSNEWMPYHFKGLKDSVLQTLICHKCGNTSIGFAAALYAKPVDPQSQAIIMKCTSCGENAATCPRTGSGVSREQLADIYNLFDVYVQASIAEGDGIPATEAKACGVPVIVTDHSSLSEKGRFPAEYCHFKELGIKESDYSVHKGGMITEVAGYRHEPETHCQRAVSNIPDLAKKMRDLVTNDVLRKKMSKEARECAEENYDWNELWKNWDSILTKVRAKDRSQTWNTPIRVIPPIEKKSVPENLTDEEFIEWLYLEILGYPEIDENGERLWLSYLRQGATRDQIYDRILSIAQDQRNHSFARESLRSNAYGGSVQSENTVEWI